MKSLNKPNEAYEYLPSIDALRFISFLLIIANHTNISRYLEGHSFFFTLTGFLITYVTVSRIRKDHTFSFRQYLAKRFLRTLPLFYLIVFLCFGIAAFSKFAFNQQISTGKLWPYLLLIQNYFDQNILFALSNLWAMAVTEQYYILFGIFCLFFRSKIKLFGFLLVVVGLIINAVSHFVYDSYHYFYSYHYLPSFGVGSILGFFCFERQRNFFTFSKAGKLPVIVYMLLACLLLTFTLLNYFEWMYPFKSFFLSIAYFLIIFNIAFAGHAIINLDKIKWMQYLGKRTFGMYCWHAPVMIVLKKITLTCGWKIDAYMFFFITLMLTIAISIISYRYFESYFLRLKRYF